MSQRKGDFRHKIDRRSFLSRTTTYSLGIGAMVNTLAHLRLMNAAFANTNPLPGDYKALVCIFFRGGCDMNNVLIPVGTNPQKNAYVIDRGIAGQPETIVEAQAIQAAHGLADRPISVESENTYITTNPPLALHPTMPKMAGMFNAGDLAFVANCGTLAEYMPESISAADYNQAIKPIQLFSHSNQVNEMMSSVAEKPFTSGWGGRVAGLFEDTDHPDSFADGSTSMMITVAGNNDFMVSPPGTNIPQYSVTNNGAISLAGYGTNYANALDSNGNYENDFTGRRLKAYERIMNYTHDHIMEEGYNEIVRRARANEELVGTALTDAATSGVDFDAIWNTHGADTNLGNELKMIAQLIAGRNCLGNRRQIFFCDLGGWDNHQTINTAQPNLLSQVDNACAAFNQAMTELGNSNTGSGVGFAYDDVSCFQASDFNRTWTPNGTNYATNGTDHAWGTHCFMFGGAVNGGDIYGKYPELAVGGANDVPGNNVRGRWIPQVATDQMYARIAKWFGVEPNELDAIFPNLSRFADPFDNTPGGPNLDFMALT